MGNMRVRSLQDLPDSNASRMVFSVSLTVCTILAPPGDFPDEWEISSENVLLQHSRKKKTSRSFFALTLRFPG